MRRHNDEPAALVSDHLDRDLCDRGSQAQDGPKLSSHTAQTLAVSLDMTLAGRYPGHFQVAWPASSYFHPTLSWRFSHLNGSS